MPVKLRPNRVRNGHAAEGNRIRTISPAVKYGRSVSEWFEDKLHSACRRLPAVGAFGQLFDDRSPTGSAAPRRPSVRAITEGFLAERFSRSERRKSTRGHLEAASRSSAHPGVAASTAACCGSRCARSAAARRCRPGCHPAYCPPSRRPAARSRPTRRNPGRPSGSTGGVERDRLVPLIVACPRGAN